MLERNNSVNEFVKLHNTTFYYKQVSWQNGFYCWEYVIVFYIFFYYLTFWRLKWIFVMFYVGIISYRTENAGSIITTKKMAVFFNNHK